MIGDVALTSSGEIPVDIQFIAVVVSSAPSSFGMTRADLDMKFFTAILLEAPLFLHSSLRRCAHAGMLEYMLACEQGHE